MDIEIKKSEKPVKYDAAIKFMENRLDDLNDKKCKELIWVLEHDELYTAGTSSKESEILDKSIKIIKTNRGGKITYHGPGQLVCYFVIDLKKRKKDIRKFISTIEKTIISTLKYFNIEAIADKKNIGIWYKDKSELKKVAAIGVRVKKWIAYHGFSININNDLNKYKAIVPCGINDKGVTTLEKINKQSYKNFDKKLIENFILNLKN
jgi:lipoyl(octanoyl) transferase